MDYSPTIDLPLSTGIGPAPASGLSDADPLPATGRQVPTAGDSSPAQREKSRSRAAGTGTVFDRACTVQTTVATPLGPMLLARTPRGLAGAWFVEGQKDHPGRLAAPEAPDDPLLADVARQLTAYFGGEAVRFEAPLDFLGTPFQVAVWQALCDIGHGATASYGEVARRVGAPGAARAVGAAVGRNPMSVIVPCHRVLGTGGALTGYGGGLDRKTALLRLEGVLS